MPTTTPLNGWPVPVSTDLVKDGAVAIESLGDAIDASVGSGLLAWQSWAPTLSDGWTNGTGTWSAWYAKIGRIVHVKAIFTTGNGNKGTNFTLSLPVTANNNIGAYAQGVAGATIGGVVYSARVLSQSTTTSRVLAERADQTYVSYVNFAAAIPAAWAASGDIIRFSFSYEAAA